MQSPFSNDSQIECLVTAETFLSSRPWSTQLIGYFYVKFNHSKEICILYCKYLRYRHKTNTVVFDVISAIKQTKAYISSDIIGKFAYSTMLFILQLTHTASSVRQL